MRIAAIAIVFAGGLLAQRGPSVSPSGFGRVMFPGGGPTGAYTGAASAGAYGSVVFPGGTVPTTPIMPGAPVPSGQRNRGRNQPAIVPYPVFVGGSYYNYDPSQTGFVNYGPGGQAWPTPGQPGFSGSSYVQPVYAPVGEPAAPRQETSPTVVINQYFRQDEAPVTRTSSQGASSSSAVAPATPEAETAAVPLSADMQNIFLIAMTDHTIYAANSYWVEDNTLNYITIQGTENSVSMDLVDRELSRRLNRDRKIAFGLPNN